MKDKLTRELIMTETRLERAQVKREALEEVRLELAEEELEKTRLEQEQAKMLS